MAKANLNGKNRPHDLSMRHCTLSLKTACELKTHTVHIVFFQISNSNVHYSAAIYSFKHVKVYIYAQDWGHAQVGGFLYYCIVYLRPNTFSSSHAKVSQQTPLGVHTSMHR